MSRRRDCYCEDGPGAAFHITARVNWQVWHLAPTVHRNIFMRELVRALEACEVDLLAFAMMVNHYHLVTLSPPEEDYRRRTGRRTACRHFRPWPDGHPNASVMSQFRRRLSRMTSQAIQREIEVTGHFWECGSHARTILDPGDLVTTIAYDHRNPVAAGACTSAEAYPWSSAAWWAGTGESVLPVLRLGRAPFGLTTDELRLALTDCSTSPAFGQALQTLADEGLDPRSDEGRARLQGLLHEAGVLPASPRCGTGAAG